jgi:hypothetical protein
MAPGSAEQALRSPPGPASVSGALANNLSLVCLPIDEAQYRYAAYNNKWGYLKFTISELEIIPANLLFLSHA